MPSFLTELGGFTPVVDIVTQDVGLMTSVVYGLVWRHCQMKDGVCKKSAPELAEMLEISDRTIRRHLNKLCERGYIRDLTPELKNRPHIYADTGKVKITGKVEADLPDSALTESQGRPDRESGPPGLSVRAALTESPMSKTVRLFEEDGETPAPPIFFEELVKKAIVIYTETSGLKLDKTQGRAITALIRESPAFNLERWRGACTSVRLAGVRAENVQCRIDTYLAGGNYQSMVGRHQAGPPPAPRPVLLDEAQRAAYEAQLAADRAATAETGRRIEGLVNGANLTGVDVHEEMQKVAKRKKF